MASRSTLDVQRVLMRLAERLRARAQAVGGDAGAVLEVVAQELESEAVGKKPKVRT